VLLNQLFISSYICPPLDLHRLEIDWNEIRKGDPVPRSQAVTTDGENLATNATEQEAIRWMSALRIECRSLRQIAAELTRRGLASKTGRPWSAQAISNILARQTGPLTAQSG
jgi:hypothetical protein